MRLLLLFVVLPAVELALLIQLGRYIGTLPTILLIVVTGVVGATLARAQGLRVLQQLQQEAQAGRVPAAPLVDGAIILVAATLLVTPGVLTDAFGFACLIPGTRQLMKNFLRRAYERAVQSGRLHVSGRLFEAEDEHTGPIIDIEPQPENEARAKARKL